MYLFLHLLISTLFRLQPSYLSPQTIPSQNRCRSIQFEVEPPTLVCAGFEWSIAGDKNRNASVEVSYRKKGDQDWKPALPLLRIGGERIYGHEQRWEYLVPDKFAGSIFNLQPATWYECRFRLSDPDGIEGETEHLVNIQTRAEPQPFPQGQVYHVYPPGHTGPKEQPAFTGLNEAYYGIGNTGDWWNVPEARVRPGDIILVHAGLYKGNRLRYADALALDFHGAYVFTQKGTADRPITIKAAGDGEVIFDGDGAYHLFDVMAADYHYFEGLTIRNTDIAFYAGLKKVMGCSGLTVKNCRIHDVGIGVVTYSADSRDFYIADNILTGRHDPDTLVGWYGLENPAPLTSYYAIKVYGQGHVVCHNTISFFHDGVCIDTHGLPEDGKACVSIDIYRNDIFNMSDDFIEADGGVHNIRVFENRGFNSYHSALSAQPVFGGPVYFIRNICYHIPGTALKYTVRPSGIYTLHNTFIAEAAITNFSNGHFRNNLFIGPDDTRPSLQATNYTTYSSLDYNFYREKPAGPGRYRWRSPLHDSLNQADDKELGMRVFNTLEEFRQHTGMEKHGMETSPDIFMQVPLPDPKQRGRIYPKDGYDFQLKAEAEVIDKGVVLPNINDGYSGKGPDPGALEYGQAGPGYGPRSRE
ncbi:MAG TPA: hypothetical protein PKM27_00455 [Saprospiraceae bacterium]|nr:hypothetical protein [Saprospiraceae bacterium]HNT19238.1 hypothetical protein [Saprospiraceae bacterium]